METIDIERNYYKKRVYCPSCFKTQVKKLDSNEFYIQYQCWNKNCEEKNIPFIILNKYIQDEEAFDGYCDTCHEPLHREFKIDKNQNLKLIFKCKIKFCEAKIDPYCYDFSINNWESKSPRVRLFEDMLDSNKSGFKIIETPLKEKILPIIENEDNIDSTSLSISISEDSQETESLEQIYKIEEIPLLTMNNDEYSKFLEHHQNKVVCLVDLPNFIRTLREFFPRDFENVLKKAHLLLLQYIENSFHASDNYIIRYFSKPAKDLEIPNNIIINFYTNQKREFFHLLKVLKGAGYSDIDNYLIANSVEILERCEIRGFVIVSSDKDYLPVMRIASYKKIKSRILGINTSDIYEKYNIDDIKFLGIMKFFNK